VTPEAAPSALPAKLREASLELTGSAVGAAVGGAIGGPVGLVVGAAIPPLTKLGADFLGRQVSPRETARVGTFLVYAEQKIYENVMNGLQVRHDDYFTPPNGGQAACSEIAEAAAMAAQREAQERKVRYYGYLVGNLAFHPEIDGVTAFDLLRSARQLSYTQLQLLAAVQAPDLKLPPHGKQGQQVSWRAVSVSREFGDLGYAARELIGVKRPEGNALATNLGVPSDQLLSIVGNALYELMDLDRIPRRELVEVVSALWEHAGFPAPDTLSAGVGQDAPT